MAAPLLPLVLLFTPPAPADAVRVPVPRVHWTVASVAAQAAPPQTIRWNQAPARSANGSTRGRRALIGALIGFGVGLPVGMATAGYIGDEDRPGTGARFENGARFGALGAGIGALVGALTGRSK